jgi:hypothetical protein
VRPSSVAACDPQSTLRSNTATGDGSPAMEARVLLRRVEDRGGFSQGEGVGKVFTLYVRTG